jgi:catechol 2,3-dioxygenase-like lactoylglutathione lyase family enzyme
MFGARIVTTRQIYGGTVVRLDLNGQLALIGPPVGSPPLVPATLQPQFGLIHFGLRTDNLEKAVDELKAKGVTFAQEITPLGTSRISYFRAPEGVLVELQQY